MSAPAHRRALHEARQPPPESASRATRPPTAAVAPAPTEGDLTLADRLAAVRERIAGAAPEPSAVRLVAVTKGFGADVVRAALDAGLVDLGESYVQELVAKAREIDAELDDAERAGRPAPRPTPCWHAIGRLQRNKVRKAAPYVALWHSVDRLSLGAEIARQAPGAAVLVQVNASGEEQKGGCAPSMAPGLVDGLRDLGLDVRGVMAIAPYGPAEAARPAFRTARQVRDRLGLTELSMGMSADLEVALQEGATLVRVGTGLFGPRPSQGQARD